MIVAILLAFLNRSGQRRYFKDVFVGVGAAVVLATGGGVLAYYTVRTYAGSRAQTIFETITFLVAATLLTYMTFWMRRHARGLAGELKARADDAVTRGTRWGMGLLAFQAVGREGLETVVFTLAIVFSTSSSHALAGALLGLACAIGVAVWVYRLGHRINLGRFFTIVGALLMVFAAALLADAVENLQQLGWLPLRAPLWDTGRVLSEDSAVGDVAHSFLGYASAPTALQIAVYVGYLAVALVFFLGVPARVRAERTASPAGRPSA
jgi:high-affinity iron transporter